jgi:hypothetical protein
MVNALVLLGRESQRSLWRYRALLAVSSRRYACLCQNVPQPLRGSVEIPVPDVRIQETTDGSSVWQMYFYGETHPDGMPHYLNAKRQLSPVRTDVRDVVLFDIRSSSGSVGMSRPDYWVCWLEER